MTNVPPRQLSLFDDPAFYEAVDVEFKSARGGVPASLWETYSAFANSDGGTIYLGISEKSGQLEIHGLENSGKVIDELYSTAHNSNKISINLLSNTSIDTIDAGKPGRLIVRMKVPRANRSQRPVFLNKDPFGQSFRRDHTGDYRCTAEEVRRMFADQSSEPSDSRILAKFSLEDLHTQSLQQFRQRVASSNPSHPWLVEEDIPFLRKLGGWRKDRNTDVEGLTVAGLLMFGREEVIRAPEALPQFHLDYRERTSDLTHERWSDRLTIDGTWEGNIFQFYNRVLPRLASTVKAPFQLDANLYRYDESAVAVALREALVNALIHADYSGQGGIVIDRFPDRIDLSNPGTLLVSHDQLLRGGISECRNKSLQLMFQLMGAGDKAGSGLDKIRASWADARLRAPSLAETQRPDRVRLDLPMSTLLPEHAVGQLAHHFGPMFNDLRPEEVQILVMAYEEGPITNSKLQDVLTMHRVDLTKVLQHLAKDGYLERKGFGRWTSYDLPEAVDRAATDRNARQANRSRTAPQANDNDGDVDDDGTSDGTYDSSAVHEGTSDGTYDGTGIETRNRPGGDRVDADHADQHSSGTPPYLSAKGSNPELWASLLEIGKPARARRAMMTSELTTIIVRLCEEAEWLSREELGELVGRNGYNLRDRTLGQMIADGQLRMRYPQKNHPNQAYAVPERST